MYIQYVGFDVAAGCRIYNFKVLNEFFEPREFALRVETEAFCPTALRLQEGPDICFGRLKRELEAETEVSRTEARLNIGEQDIQEFMERRRPAKEEKRKWDRERSSSPTR